MKSQYPSHRPEEFADTLDGLVAMLFHDYQWAVGSGYTEEGEFDEAYLRSIYAVDGNGNLVRLETPTAEGLQIVRLVENGRVYHRGVGYIVDATDPEGRFGDDNCPSSYGRPCLT